MATYEKNALVTVKDTAGDKHLIYPITKMECVDGLDGELLKKISFDKDRKLDPVLLHRGYTSDANTAFIPGTYVFGPGCLNLPRPGYGVLTVSTANGLPYQPGIFTGENWMWQEAKYTAESGVLSDIYCRNISEDRAYSEWSLKPSTKPPQEFPLPLVEGVTAGRKTNYSKAYDNFIVVSFNVNFASAESRTKAIAILPPGYLPEKLETDSCIVSSSQGDLMAIAIVEVVENGVVRVYANAAGYTNATGKISFYATH